MIQHITQPGNRNITVNLNPEQIRAISLAIRIMPMKNEEDLSVILDVSCKLGDVDYEEYITQVTANNKNITLTPDEIKVARFAVQYAMIKGIYNLTNGIELIAMFGNSNEEA